MSATTASLSETGPTLRGTTVPAVPGRAAVRALLRPAVVALAVPGVVVATLALCREPLVSVRAELDAGARWSALPLDLLLTCLAATALCAGVLWLAAATLAATVEAVTGLSSGIVRAISPRVVRNLVLVCCGVAVSGPALVVPAVATVGHETQGPGAAPTSPGPTAAVAGLPLPDRAMGTLPEPETSTPPDPETSTLPDRSAATLPNRAASTQSEAAGSATPPTSTPGRQGRTTPRVPPEPRVVSPRDDHPRSAGHRVRPGESLWSIARRMLPDADLTALDSAWRDIYRINRHVIGPDPDLILPGTTLRLPPAAPRSAPNLPPGDLGAPRHRKDEP